MTQIPVVIDGVTHYYIDMGLEELEMGGEYDGDEWHSAPAQKAHDSARRRVLSEEEGWLIEVFRRTDVFGHWQDAECRLKAAYNAARERRGMPRNFF